MKEFVVKGANVEFNPRSEEAEILQNVRTIIGTRKGTVPLDRDFGLSWQYVDRPLPVLELLMKAEIVDAIEKYEPRAKVVDIRFESSADGLLNGQVNPVVTINIVGDEKHV